MTDYILAATNRYEGDGEMIHSIHKTDGLIITVLTDILRKHNDTATVEILEKYYKYESDADVLALLKEIEKKLKVSPPQNNPADIPRYHIVQGRRLDLFLLISYNSVDSYTPTGVPIFLITLNPCPDKAKEIPYYANEVLYFPNVEERDKTLKVFDDFMGSVRGGFIEDFAGK